MNSDNRDWKQTLPKDLDNDEDYHGRDHMLALMSTRAQPSQYDMFIEISRSFLLVMTHTAMVDCLSVDTYVGSLYNFISGTNGTRAIPFFQHICVIIVATRAEATQTVPLRRLESTLVALLNALTEILRREPRARYNGNLPELVNLLETMAQLMNEDGPTVTSNVIINRVCELRAVLARACGLLSEETEVEFEEQSTSALRSTYPRNIVMPGERHDNDKVDITQINVFPTRAEIMSDARDFLPSTDPDQPHFLTSKLERHIDTHFRLLRHDTLGSVKDVLGSLMKNLIDNPNQLTAPRLELGDTRIYDYPNALVSYLIFNSRGGLQARMSFPQPYSMRKRSAIDRRKVWEESRRLQEGVLLSFIWIQDSTIQHQFFTVVERSTDTRHDDSLTHNNNTATVTVAVTNQNEQAVEALLDLSRQKNRGILLEFPHVIPTTFVPVLQNLQNMQRLSRVPFCEWILPDRVDGPPGVKLDIPPPLYARHAGFDFPLASVLRRGASSISLHPSSSDNDPLVVELEAKTELDYGQCVALVAALTREFAFIQGPPGTGKSYLGVQLMKVLLGVKRKAYLGPIVVV